MYEFYKKRWLERHNTDELPVEAEIAIDFISSGCVSIVNKWANGRYNITADKIVQVTIDLFPKDLI